MERKKEKIKLYNQLNLLILNDKIDRFLKTNNIIEFCDWVNANVDENYLDAPKMEELEK